MYHLQYKTDLEGSISIICIKYLFYSYSNKIKHKIIVNPTRINVKLPFFQKKKKNEVVIMAPNRVTMSLPLQSWV